MMSHPAPKHSGSVKIHARSIFLASPHLTAENRFVAPTPMMAVVMTWVVLTGRPKWLDTMIVAAADVSAANP